MGTDKTTVGRKVAKSLGFRFVDTDQMIVKRAGKPIPVIFEEDGEEAFRKIETEVLRECSEKSGQVISTGGGIVTIPQNREILLTAGYVVWLRATPESIYNRVKSNSNRPLLRTKDPLATITDLLNERSEFYKQCHNLTITTDGLTLEETCYGVSESARLELGAA